MRDHVGILFTHHFYPLTPLFVLLSPSDPLSCTNFVTISHQMIRFLTFCQNFHLFQLFFSQMCPSLYFASKIGKNLYNSHSLTTAFVGLLTEWSLFLRNISHRKAPKRYRPSIHVPHNFRGECPHPEVPEGLKQRQLQLFLPHVPGTGRPMSVNPKFSVPSDTQAPAQA